MADELKADQVKGGSLQSCVLRGRMQPAIDEPLPITHPGDRQHVGGEIKPLNPRSGLLALFSTLMQPARQMQCAHSYGTTEIEHLLNRAFQTGLHNAVDLIPETNLRHGRCKRLLRPDTKGHGIGGLFRFSRGLPAEIALFIGMEASQVIVRRPQSRRDGARQQGGCSLLQFPASNSPGNAVAFRGADDQLTGLEEEGAPQQSDPNQAFDPATQSLT